MGETEGGGEPLSQEDVMINIQVNLAEATAKMGEYIDQMKQLGGVSVQAQDLERELLQVSDHYQTFTDVIDNWLVSHKRMIKEFTWWKFGIKLLEIAADQIDDLQQHTELLRASAGMSQQAFGDLQQDIINTSTITGEALGQVANRARDVFGATGLQEGLGEVLEAGVHMQRVFGVSAGKFEELAAWSTKFSKGTITANNLMQAFDKTVGVTGSKMEDILETLTEIGKQLFKVKGAGSGFGKSMVELTDTLSSAAAQMSRMGGDASTLGEITKGIMDIDRWNDIASTMPGMAGHLVEMQEAILKGDKAKFYELLQDGAKQTVQMAEGMDDFSRAASGIDFGNAKLIAELDFDNLSKGAEGANALAGVAQRSQKLFQSLSQSIFRVWTNFTSFLVKVFLPMFEQIAMGFAALNDSLTRNQDTLNQVVEILGVVTSIVGWAIKLILYLATAINDLIGTSNTMVIAIGAVITVMYALKAALTATATATVVMLPKAIEAAAKGVGAALNSIAGMIVGFAKVVAKGAIYIVLASVAIAALAASLWLAAKALGEFSNVNWSGFTEGINVLIANSLSIIYLALIAPALIYAGFALAMFATGLLIYANALKVLTEASVNTEGLREALTGMAMDQQVWDSLFQIGTNMNNMPEIDPSTVKSLETFVSMVKEIGDNVESFDTVASMLKDNPTLAKDMEQLFSSDGFLIRSSKAIYNAFVTEGYLWNNVKDIRKPVENLGSLVDLLSKLDDALVGIIVVSEMLKDSEISGNIDNAIASIFSKKGFLTKAVFAIYSSYYDGWDKDIEAPVVQLTKLVDLFVSLRKGLSSILATALFIKGFENLSDVNSGMVMMFGKRGFLYKAVTSIYSSYYDGWNKDISEPLDQLGKLLKLFDSLRDTLPRIIAIGHVLSDTRNRSDIKSGIDSIFGSRGFIPTMIDTISKISTNSVKPQMKSISEIMGSVGKVAASINFSDLATFQVGTNSIVESMQKYVELGRMLEDGGLESMKKVPAAMSQFARSMKDMGQNVKISSSNETSSAFNIFNQKTEHEENVENLLTEIRDALVNIGPQGQKEASGNVATAASSSFSATSSLFSETDSSF